MRRNDRFHADRRHAASFSALVRLLLVPVATDRAEWPDTERWLPSSEEERKETGDTFAPFPNAPPGIRRNTEAIDRLLDESRDEIRKEFEIERD